MKFTNLTQSGHQEFLGNSTTTIGRAGCMLTCFTMAANALTPTSRTVVEMNEALKKAGAFSGGSIVRDLAAHHLGMAMRFVGTVDLKSSEVFAALARGELVMLGVDYKPGHSSGRSNADHFILAHGTAETADKKPVVIAADPGTGHDVHLRLIDGWLVAEPSPRVKWRAVEATYFTKAAP